jgi:SAM-dependent methyltransferase
MSRKFMSLEEASRILKLYPSLSFMDKVTIWLRLIFCVRPIMLVLEQYLPKQGLILDMGCGYGIISNLISTAYPNSKVIGIDIASHRIEVAKESADNRENLEFYPIDIRESLIPICNAVILIDVLYMLPYKEQKQILLKCYEKLDSNGVMIIKDSGKSPYWKYAYMYIEERFKIKLGIYGRNVSKVSPCFWDSKEFLSLLKTIGFKASMVSVDSWLPYPGVIYICHKS